MGAATQDRFWYACADLSAFLNLFNVIPMPPFDGGRIVAALWPPLWIVGFALFVGFAVFVHLPILFVLVIGLLGLPAMTSAWRGHVDPRAEAMTFAARVRISVWYLATLFGLFFVMAQSHAIASPGSRGTIF
jgi:Zn-dependent protease